MAYDVSGLPTEFFNPGELEVFLGLIETYRPKVIIEFGIQRGRNAAAALRNFPWVERYIGSTSPAGRLTYSHIVGARLP